MRANDIEEEAMKISLELLKAVLHACATSRRRPPCVKSGLFGGHIADTQREMEKRPCA